MPFVDNDHARAAMRTYCHVAGIIQWFIAAFFGRLFYDHVGTYRLYNPAFQGKGGYSPAYWDFSGLFFLTVVALLSIAGFIAGWGLVRLRPWVRRWEATYLGVLLIATASAFVGDMSRGFRAFESLTPLMLFSAAFALPYLPFLCTDVMAYMAEAARLLVRTEKPVAASVSLWDASVDG